VLAQASASPFFFFFFFFFPIFFQTSGFFGRSPSFFFLGGAVLPARKKIPPFLPRVSIPPFFFREDQRLLPLAILELEHFCFQCTTSFPRQKWHSFLSRVFFQRGIKTLPADSVSDPPPPSSSGALLFRDDSPISFFFFPDSRIYPAFSGLYREDRPFLEANPSFPFFIRPFTASTIF